MSLVLRSHISTKEKLCQLKILSSIGIRQYFYYKEKCTEITSNIV